LRLKFLGRRYSGTLSFPWRGVGCRYSPREAMRISRRSRRRMAYQDQTEQYPFERPARRRPDLRVVPAGSCPEHDCLRDRLDQQTIAVAEARAQFLGVGADEVLIAHGIVSEDEYTAALAASLGIRVDPLDFATRIACPYDGGRLLAGVINGSVPQQVG